MIALDMGPGMISRKVNNTGYGGVITLEPMNWDYAHLNMQYFLRLAYERAGKLEQMICN